MVYANGVTGGDGTHVSVFVYLMRGEHDDKLTWPFLGDITIQLVNQNRDKDHVEKSFNFTDAAFDEISGRVTSGERAKHSWGHSKFVSHAKLESTAGGTKQYLDKKDCMRFRVSKIVVHSI